MGELTSYDDVDLKHVHEYFPERCHLEDEEIIAVSLPPVEKTLLQKALAYRKQHPHRWEDRRQEVEKKFQKSVRNVLKTPFLEAYYSKVEERNEEKIRLNLIKIKQPPTISIQLSYKNDAKISKDEEKVFLNQHFDISDSSQFTIIEKRKDGFGGQKPSESNKEEIPDATEFYIKLRKAWNLGNALGKGIPRLLECKVNFKLHSNDLKKGYIRKNTKYQFCNVRGKTTWDHVFAIKGYSLEELSRMYIVLEIVAKNQNDKLAIGATVIAGRNAQINHEYFGQVISPAELINDEWEEALNNPERIISLTKSLERKPKHDFGAALSALLSKEVEAFKHKMEQSRVAEMATSEPQLLN